MLYVQRHNDVSVYHENIRILVVDDDVNIATVIRQCLIADEETVFDVASAHDGLRCLGAMFALASTLYRD